MNLDKIEARLTEFNNTNPTTQQQEIISSLIQDVAKSYSSLIDKNEEIQQGLYKALEEKTEEPHHKWFYKLIHDNVKTIRLAKRILTQVDSVKGLKQYLKFTK